MQEPFALKSSLFIKIMFLPFLILGLVNIPTVLKSKNIADTVVWVYVPITLLILSISLKLLISL